MPDVPIGVPLSLWEVVMWAPLGRLDFVAGAAEA